MVEHSLNKANPFVRGYYINRTVCDSLVAEIRTANMEQDTSDFRKYSFTWLETFSENVKASYVNEVIGCVEEYKKEFDFCYKDINVWTLKSGIKVQKYEPGTHYSIYHAENTGDFRNISRNLVFMTYLHDMQDEGGTEFYYQKLKVKPEKGLTLVWPSDWTHVHRGVLSNTEEKLITTGWFVYDLTSRYTGF
jgi:hypothetical protein